MQTSVNAILTSTFYDQNYAPNTLMRSYELLFPNGHTETHLDLGDWDYRAIIKSISVYTPYVYNGYEKFTSIINRVYGNTTCYRIVLTFNGFMHPYEIDGGATINLPDPTELRALIQERQLKRRTTPLTDVLI